MSRTNLPEATDKFDWTEIPYYLCRPANMDGDGGRGMSLCEVKKMTLAQAIYFLRSKKKKEVSRAEAYRLQQRQGDSAKRKSREKMQALINWANGVS